MTDPIAPMSSAPSATDANGERARNRRQVAAWLLLCCALVLAMVVLGGVTRLTGSGLSMVNWEPVTGVLPPLSDSAWQQEFDAYRQSPEYRLKNYGMNVDEFKRIFAFEFAHRLLGRLIGVVFLGGFLYLVARRRIERALVPKLLVMFVLGGLQGVLGWYMVKSGLVNDPHVSQYRLTAHLAAALAIYLYMFKVALLLLEEADPSVPPAAAGGLVRAAFGTSALAVLTVLSGGFVAGLKAGLSFNTFPLMDGALVPVGIYNLQPWWRNLFENTATVQFDHRLLAMTTLVVVLTLVVTALRRPLPARVRLACWLAGGVVLAQVSLGIATLLLHVPVALAATHQGGAIVLVTALVLMHHRLAHG